MIRLSVLAAIFVQVAATAALATQLLLFGGAATSSARPAEPPPATVTNKAPVYFARTLFDKPDW